MKPYILSSSARIVREAEGSCLVFNGINVQLWLPHEFMKVLRLFEQPRTIGTVLEQAGTSPQLELQLAEMCRHLFLVPAEPDHTHDMRLTWNCLAQGTDADAANVIDNETRTVEEFGQSGREALEALRALIRLQPEWCVVNIGCGMGRLERFLAPEVSRLIGFDVSDLMIERARNYLAGCPNVELHRADQGLPQVATESVDLVISFLVFQHCPKEVTWSYFSEAARVLRPGSPFVFQILCYAHSEGFDPAPASPAERYYGRGKPRYADEEVRRELAVAGFTIEMFRDGRHDGIERRLAGTNAPHWQSKLVRARRSHT